MNGLSLYSPFIIYGPMKSGLCPGQSKENQKMVNKSPDPIAFHFWFFGFGVPGIVFLPGRNSVLKVRAR
jgi:hypothetical protein